MGIIHIISQLMIAVIVGMLLNYFFCNILINRLVRQKEVMIDKLMKSLPTSINSNALLEKISSNANIDQVRPMIAAHIDNFLQVKLQEKIPAVAMFVSGSTLEKLKAGMLEEIDALLPKVMQTYMEQVSQKTDFTTLFTSYVTSISDNDFRVIIKKLFSSVVQKFILLGGLTGIIIAIIQMLVSFAGIWMEIAAE
jgi:uncharacterized membrane protein YheB (UPF0754 family)